MLHDEATQEFSPRGVLNYFTNDEYPFELGQLNNDDAMIHYKPSDRYLHELLFHRQKALEDGDLRRYVTRLGLDIAAFDRDRASTAVAMPTDEVPPRISNRSPGRIPSASKAPCAVRYVSGSAASTSQGSVVVTGMSSVFGSNTYSA